MDLIHGPLTFIRYISKHLFKENQRVRFPYEDNVTCKLLAYVWGLVSYPAAIFSPFSWEGDRLKPFTVARWPWRDAPSSSGQGKPYIRENANVSKTVESLSWPLKNQSRTTHRTLSYCYCCWFFFSFRFSFFLKNNSNDKNNDKNIFLMSHCKTKFSNHSSIQRGP